MNTFWESIRRMLANRVVIGLALAAMTFTANARELEVKPADAYFEKFAPQKAPPAGQLMLRPGDRLAICGDSITEQKMYSRIIETYLAVCMPQLRIDVRQYGWSGETAEGFLGRMESDCLRFKPTVATTSYGMNDYKYRPYDEANARWYRERYTEVVRKFKNAGVRVVLGSPGCVGKVASWVKSGSGTLEDHNLHLCALRNIGIGIASRENTRFADVFWPMFTASFEARRKFGPDYAVAGKDGVHPGWAGHLLMAYAYLRAMGLDGAIGTITVDLKTNRAEATAGQEVQSFQDGKLKITSRRYPFCATGNEDKDDSIRSGMVLAPFNPNLNRLMLVARGGPAASYKITWGGQSRVYSAEQLTQGVNLAADFPVNPFSEVFRHVDEAVAAKQAFETTQIKDIFHGEQGKVDLAAAVARTEAKRALLVKARQDAFVPVTHTLGIEPVDQTARIPAMPAWIELLPGKGLSAWREPHGDWILAGNVVLDPRQTTKLAWQSGGDTAVNGPTGRTVNLLSAPEFGDCKVHVEFMIPKGSNSGVYFMGRYELQIYDSYGVVKDKYPGIECGGIYPRWVGHEIEGHSPRVNASLPPGAWQTFDVVFLAPGFDAAGKKIRNAKFVRVLHNGKLIHENVEVTGPTRASYFEDEQPTGPLMLQADHGPVAYRSVRVVKLSSPKNSSELDGN